MRSVSLIEVLALWEQGCGQSLLRQAILLLGEWLGQPAEETARLTIGQRDFALLNFRAALFGPDMVGLTVCPTCRQRVEVHMNADEIASSPPRESDQLVLLVQDGYEAQFRLPTSRDLDGLSPDADLTANRQRLLERCLVSLRRGETEVPFMDIPESLVSAVDCRLAEADPLADIQLTIDCPACRHRWETSLDIVSFLWSEVNAWAERLLTEVHLLASAYGWTEHEILHLSTTRRQFYLNLIGR